VPINQRDYSWTDEEIDTLWQDLTAVIEDGRGEYFLGAIVLSPPENDEQTLEIVDGQQRLATLTMILSAIRLAWQQMGDADRAADMRSHYLGSRDRRTKDTIPKLSLNENWAATDAVDTTFSLRVPSSRSPQGSGNPGSSAGASDCRTVRCSRTRPPEHRHEIDSASG